MVLLRALLVCVLALAPLGMASAATSDVEGQTMIVNCHEMAAVDDTTAPAKHCSGMQCCVIIEQASINIDRAGYQMRIGYSRTAAHAHIPTSPGRPDKPPRAF